MKKIFLLFSLLCSGILAAQDPQFSMPYSSSLYLNPGFAGTSGVSRVQGQYRNQWPNISGTYVTSFLSYDQYFKGVAGGVGINYLRDVSGQGTLMKNRIGLTYSYVSSFLWPDAKICFGFDGAYVQRKVDWSKLTFGTSGTFVGMDKEIISYTDISCGVLFYKRQFNGGFAVWHLAEPEEGFVSGSPLPMKYVGHFGVNIGNPDTLKGFSLTPSALYLQQGDFRSFIIQCAANYSNYIVGIGYRNGDAIIGSVGFRTKQIRLAYSYDLTISKLGIVSGGSHEISFSLIFNRKAKPEGFSSFSSASF